MTHELGEFFILCCHMNSCRDIWGQTHHLLNKTMEVGNIESHGNVYNIPQSTLYIIVHMSMGNKQVI